jgi:nitrous oxidase accessory protein NosD
VAGICTALVLGVATACSGPSAPPPPSNREQAWTAPGLVAADGTPVEVRPPAPASGERLDATDYGADPAPDGHDDAAALRAAVAAAAAGDEVVLPAGIYDLRSTDPGDDTADVSLPAGVRLRGAGMGLTVLRSSFDGEDDSAVLRAAAVEDVVIADLTITSAYEGPLGEDPEDGDAGGGPMYGVHIIGADGRPSERVRVERVEVERFQRHGISVKASRDVVVTGCRVSDATSVGPGGSGYGIVVEGRPDQRDPEAADDSRHNVVMGNHLAGEHLRHAILLQFPTHNNLVADNRIDGSVLDAIDLHGEGEYLNEIRHNVVTGGQRAGIALGNSGGEVNQHDATGEGNWIHDNTLTGNQQGVLVILGTPDTLVEGNEITPGDESEAGIELRNAPGTVVRGNRLVGGGEDYWGIRIEEDEGADGREAGVAVDVLVEENTVARAANGIRVDAGRDITLRDNRFVQIDGLHTQVADDAEVDEPDGG